MFCLRPHHLIDIIRNIGQERPNVPHPYGHAQHIITSRLLGQSIKEVQFIIGADDLCKPCKHLINGKCEDMLPQLEGKVSKHHYNNDLDRRVAEYLGLKEGEIMRLDEFLDMIEQKLTGLIPLCSHPKENMETRLDGLQKGIEKLRLRTTQD